MTFLPIVERELRIAARRRSTFWLRIVAALVAVVIGGGFMMLSILGGSRTSDLGGYLFGALTWMVLATALAAGIFFTADSLSEEKREGTLGFLFLTDLRGYDVVFGKLLATSLRGVFALLAIFPILATTLLMGGVTGEEFWRTTLALANALLCSLAAGLTVSAISRDSQKAMAATLVVLLLWAGGGPLADFILEQIRKGRHSPLFSLTSPFYAFISAGAWGRPPFWSALFTSQALAWLMLAFASATVPRTWQERSKRRGSEYGGWSYSWRYGGVRRRGSLRRRLIDRNPVLWLACRERWQSLGLWVLAMLAVCVLGLLTALDSSTMVWMVWSWTFWLFTVTLYLLVASQSCRFFLEARRTGLLELLLASPLNARQIADGQWRALLRLLAPPLLVLIATQIIGTAVSQYLSWGRAAMPAGVKAPSALALTLVSALLTPLVTGANLAALSWFGMWMGMTSKNTALATLKAIVFVQILPSFVMTFVAGLASVAMMAPQILLAAGGKVPQLAAWLPVLLICLPAALSLLKDAAFIAWSRQRLYSSLREQAARTVGFVQFRPPPVAASPVAGLVPVPATPPPITAPQTPAAP